MARSREKLSANGSHFTKGGKDERVTKWSRPAHQYVSSTCSCTESIFEKELDRVDQNQDRRKKRKQAPLSKTCLDVARPDADADADVDANLEPSPFSQGKES